MWRRLPADSEGGLLPFFRGCPILGFCLPAEEGVGLGFFLGCVPHPRHLAELPVQGRLRGQRTGHSAGAARMVAAARRERHETARGYLRSVATRMAPTKIAKHKQGTPSQHYWQTTLLIDLMRSSTQLQFAFAGVQ